MKKTTVTRRYTFEAAHFLPHVREGHKCKRMHGHNYEIEVTVAGPVVDPPNEGAGFIVDFWDLDYVVNPIVQEIDHRVLNDLAGLENPTAENIAAWFARLIELRLNVALPDVRVVNVRCYETKDCWADVSAG